MSIDPTQDYFTLFGLPRRFAVDEAALEAAWHRMQAQVHPDRHAHLPESERRQAMQWATRVNEGFRTLKNPLARAQYLLVLAGVDAGLETNTVMAPDFLVEQMEWREAVEEARAAREVGALEQLHQGLARHEREVREHLQVELDERHDYHAAADTVRRLMFSARLRQDIDDALFELEDD